MADGAGALGGGWENRGQFLLCLQSPFLDLQRGRETHGEVKAQKGGSLRAVLPNKDISYTQLKGAFKLIKWQKFTYI